MPPHHGTLTELFNRDPYGRRSSPFLLRVEALPKPTVPNSTSFEVTVASAVVRVLTAPAEAGTAYLSLLQVVNERASLRVLLEAIAEALWPQGVTTLTGPVGASPYLEQGALASHWQLLPPLHTPYNPPYLPELCAGLMQPAGSLALYRLEVLARAPDPGLPALAPERLGAELLPLFQAATEACYGLPPIGAEEARFVLRLLAPYPLAAYLAMSGGLFAGFVLLQPDLAPLMRAAWGARSPIGSLRFARHKARPARHGRLLFLGVLPEARRQGLGSMLLAQALAHASAQGWESLSVGPVANHRFLLARGATPAQNYTLYRYSF